MIARILARQSGPGSTRFLENARHRSRSLKDEEILSSQRRMENLTAIDARREARYRAHQRSTERAERKAWIIGGALAFLILLVALTVVLALTLGSL